MFCLQFHELFYLIEYIISNWDASFHVNTMNASIATHFQYLNPVRETR